MASIWSQGDDVAYTLNVGQTTTFDFTLCSMVTDYDTKLEIFTNDQDCVVPHPLVIIMMMTTQIAQNIKLHILQVVCLVLLYSLVNIM